MKEWIDFNTLIDRSGTYSVKYDERKAKFGRDDCLPLWVADMDLPAPRSVTDALIRRAAHPIYGYTIYPDRFFEAIVAWMKRRHGWHIGKEAVVPVPGVVPALDFLVTALTPPDGEILIQPPVYHPFFRLAAHHGRTLLTNPLRLEGTGYKIDFDDFSAKAKEADLFILCSPHNPVGRVWKEEELEKMASICLEEECLLISDEIHADIVHAPNRHIPIASISTQIAHNTVTLNAPSKTFNIAGLNTAYAIVENDSIRRKLLSALRRYDLTMGNVFGIEALMAAYEEGEEWLEKLLAYLEENIEFVIRYLRENIPQIRAIKPEATFLLWLDCRNLGMDDERLKHFFVDEAGLGLNPGADFGQEGSGFMRMNVGCPREALEEAMHRLKRALDATHRHTQIP